MKSYFHNRILECILIEVFYLQGNIVNSRYCVCKGNVEELLQPDQDNLDSMASNNEEWDDMTLILAKEEEERMKKD